MKLEQLIYDTRVLVKDKKYNSNSSSSDTFFSDNDIVTYLNNALDDFDTKTGLITSAYTSDLTINVVADEELYTLPSEILHIKSVTQDGRPIREYNFYNEHPIITHFYGFSRGYSLDFESGIIRFYPKPVQDSVVKIRATIKTKHYTIDDLEEELPLDVSFHSYFKWYIASKLLLTSDNDAQNFQVSQIYANEWEKFVTMVRRNKINRENSRVYLDGGSYLV